MLDSINIFSTWGFIFFLVIILVWYIFVEIQSWKNYYFRKKLSVNNNHLFDRVIHYIFWWFLINIFIVALFSISWSTEWLANLFNDVWRISNSLVPIINNNVLDSQLIIFFISYFLIIISIWIVFQIIIFLLDLVIAFFYNKFIKKKKKTIIDKLINLFKK